MTPFFISTSLISFSKGFFIIEPEEFVEATWNRVEYSNPFIYF